MKRHMKRMWIILFVLSCVATTTACSEKPSRGLVKELILEKLSKVWPSVEIKSIENTTIAKKDENSWVVRARVKYEDLKRYSKMLRFRIERDNRGGWNTVFIGYDIIDWCPLE